MLLFLSMMAYGAENCVLDTCDDASSAATSSQSVLEEPLTLCSASPRTGWFRDGYCRTDTQDRGVHVVCAAMTQEFLGFTKAQGNDLSTPYPASNFPGLKPGDRWCLCASRWLEAHRAGKAPTPILSATHRKALTIIPKQTLQSAANRPADP